MIAKTRTVPVRIWFLVICVILQAFTVGIGAWAVATSDLPVAVGMGVPEFLALGALQDSWNVELSCLWLLAPLHCCWHLLSLGCNNCYCWWNIASANYSLCRVVVQGLVFPFTLGHDFLIRRVLILLTTNLLRLRKADLCSNPMCQLQGHVILSYFLD